MRSALSEKKIVVILFILVFITFSLAHEDSKKLEQLYTGSVSSIPHSLTTLQGTAIAEPDNEIITDIVPQHQE